MSNFRISDTDRLAGMLKALASPQRLGVFMKLTNCCQPDCCSGQTTARVRSCVGDLARDMNLAASTVSHHLKELRQAGVLNMERSGQRIECWVSEDALALLASFFAGAMGAATGNKTDDTVDD